MERREPNASRNYRDIGCILTEPQSPPHEHEPEEDQDRLQRQDQPQSQIESDWEESDPDCGSVAIEAVFILDNCLNRVDCERRLLATKRLGYMALCLLMRDARRRRDLLRDARSHKQATAWRPFQG